MFSILIRPQATTILHPLGSLHAVRRYNVKIHAVQSVSVVAGDDVPTAHQLLDEMSQRNNTPHNSIVAAHSRTDRSDDAWVLLARMMADGFRPTRFTFVPILSSQSFDLSRASQLHPLMLKTGLLHSDPFSATALMDLFAKHDKLCDAMKLFEEMPSRTLVTWNCIISGFSKLGFSQDAIFFFRELLRTGFRPSECSLLSILSAFRSSDESNLVEQAHGFVIKLSMDCYNAVANALLTAYSKCLTLNVVERLFNDMPMRDLVSWNTKIAAFSKSQTPERALELFFAMSLEGLSPSEATFASVLGACIGLNLPEYGEFIHAKAIKHSLSTNVFVGSSLVDFYAKCKSMKDAHNIFNEIPDKNIVMWNALISGYSDRCFGAPLTLLKELLNSGLRPTEFTFSSSLKKASTLHIQQLHTLIIKMGYDIDNYVCSTLIASYNTNDMISDALRCSIDSDSLYHVAPSNVIAGIYNRMGQYQKSKEMLFQLQNLDIISWNILINACARNGDYTESFLAFKLMQNSGQLLDNYTVVSLLSICSKTNSLEMGNLLHGLIVKTNAGCFEAFVCNFLMEMYAKCGSLEGCLRVFEKMDERNLFSWTALISALGLHGRTHEALERFKQMESSGLMPDQVVISAMLSACRHGGFVEEGILLFERMKSDYRIEPDMDHYVILVDLLCRYGHLKEAEKFISGMPFQPNAVIWRTFLQGCKRYA